MFIKKLLVAIIFVGPVILLTPFSKTFCSTATPSAGLQKYPVITATSQAVSGSGVTPYTASSITGTATELSGTTITFTVLNKEALSPVTGVTGFADVLYKVWAHRITSTATADYTISQLNDIKLDNGFMDLYPYSSALLNEYDRSHSKELLDYAMLLSPDMPEPYFNLSYRMFKSGTNNYSKAVINLSKGVSSFFEDPYNILRFISNRLINISLSLLAVFFIFALLLLIRYSMQIHALIRDYLPEYIPDYAIVLFSIVAVMLPLLFGMGFIWLLLIWLAATVAYQKLSERVFSVAFIVILALLVNIMLVAVATILKPAEEPFTGIMAIHYGNLSRNDINELTSYADSHASDLYSNLYAGVYYKRIGLYDKAYVYYRRLYDNGYSTDPAVICNMGNLEYATGNIAAAGDDYRKAISIDHDSFPAHFNLGQLYLIKADIEGTNELDIAREINPKLFTYHASIYDKSTINRIFADALPDPRVLAYDMFIDTLHSQTALGLADIIISRLIKWPSAGYLPYLALCSLLVFFIIIILSRRINKQLRCNSCGMVYSAFNRNDEYGFILCTDCLRFHIKNDIKENKKKIEITRKIHRWKKGLRGINIAASVLLPGSGYIIRGEPVKGLLVLFIFTCLMVEYISSLGLIASIFPLSNPFIPVLKSLVITALIAVYLLNLLSAVRSEVRWY